MYEHVPKEVEDNDKKLDHDGLEDVFVDKQNKNCLAICNACPCDRSVDIKQEEKVNKYLDLAVEMKELWKMKSVKDVSDVIRALGITPKRDWRTT